MARRSSVLAAPADAALGSILATFSLRRLQLPVLGQQHVDRLPDECAARDDVTSSACVRFVRNDEIDGSEQEIFDEARRRGIRCVYIDSSLAEAAGTTLANQMAVALGLDNAVAVKSQLDTRLQSFTFLRQPVSRWPRSTHAAVEQARGNRGVGSSIARCTALPTPAMHVAVARRCRTSSPTTTAP